MEIFKITKRRLFILVSFSIFLGTPTDVDGWLDIGFFSKVHNMQMDEKSTKHWVNGKPVNEDRVSIHDKDPLSIGVAVFDGHLSDGVSEFLNKNWYSQVLQYGIKKGFECLEADIFEDSTINSSGSTAVVALINPYHTCVGWVGDSRCLVGLRDGSYNVTEDHSCRENEAERSRIRAEGGCITLNHHYLRSLTFNCGVAMTRAFGDVKGRNEKIRGLSAEPEVKCYDTADIAFMVIASDGIWDLVSNDYVNEFVRACIASKMNAESIVTKFFSEEVIDKDIYDDKSLIVILFPA